MFSFSISIQWIGAGPTLANRQLGQSPKASRLNCQLGPDSQQWKKKILLKLFISLGPHKS